MLQRSRLSMGDSQAGVELSQLDHESSQAGGGSSQPEASAHEEGCELLLHYAATGAILPLRETQNVRLNNIEKKSEGHEDDGGSIMWTEESNKRKEAVAGAYLVFDLLDVVENMSINI
ncbi:hypothetical protein HHK36_011111 [Tetracentron sinense]|uniref:Uncharacterized protein n=1 Tax=Tetracentron sinense TaxID=13715 RepID=A0A834ZBE4_TETSI|nr:hypothetical protein HHK36_011111 [Tetracentron sinense]